MAKKNKKDKKTLNERDINIPFELEDNAAESQEIPFLAEGNFRITIIKLLVIIGGALFITSLIKLGILEKIKPFVLSYFYEYIYIRYSPGSLDVGIVLLGLWLTAGLAWIHYSLGISFLCLLRCWLDGYTYQTDNAYFVWGIVIVGIFYILNVFTQKEFLSLNLFIVLLFLFIITAGLTLPFSYQVGRSYRTLILWVSYLVFLILAYNASLNTWSRKFIIWSMLITLGLQTWYAFLHYQYVLPYLRKSLMLDPTLRIKFFGTAELSKELIYRFNMNRAFGTMLFPNALAGFIILILPLCFGKLLSEVKHFLCILKSSKIESSKSKERNIIFITCGLWLISVVLLFATQLFPLTYSLETESDFDFILAGALSILLALIPSGIFAWLSITKSYDAGISFVKLTILGLCFIFGSSSLWLTYSRGAWISLILSIGIFVLVKTKSTIRKEIIAYVISSIKMGILMVLLVMGTSFVYSAVNAQSLPRGNFKDYSKQQTSSESVPSTQILEEGVEVTWAHLRDPSSFKLRWSYWKVGLSMFMHNIITGVGLGNFGLAYPKYQYLGAGDVKECHNGYLQMLCETGIFSGGFFIIFIGLIFFRILHELTREKRLENLCLDIGIFSFLLHTGLDIHLSHPSLVTYLMVLLGIFISSKKSIKNEDRDFSVQCRISLTRFQKYLPAALLIIFLLLAIGAFPPYFRDLIRSKMSFINVGKDNDLQIVMKTANFVFSDVLDFGLGKINKEPKISATILRHFFVDLNKIRSYGYVYVPKGDGSNKAVLLPESEPVPENSILVVKKTWEFIYTMKKRLLKYGDIFGEIDDLFPLQDDMANYLGELYKSIYIHSSYFYQPSETVEARDKMLYWCKETLRRSPYHGDSYYNYGKALWFAGVKDDCPNNEKKKEYLLDGLKYLQKSAEYWRNVPYYWYEYIAHLKDAKKIFEHMGEQSIVSDIEVKISNSSKYAEELVKKRKELGI